MRHLCKSLTSLALISLIVFTLLFSRSPQSSYSQQLRLEQIPVWCNMTARLDQRIWAYTFAWNEERLLPFYIRHYTAFVEKIIIYDNNSTDMTLHLASLCPKVEVRNTPSNNTLNDVVHASIRSHAWKEARGKADYIIMGDLDEFIYYIRGIPTLLKQSNATLFRTIGYTMINLCLTNPNLNYSLPLTDQIKFGSRSNAPRSMSYDKVLMFSTSLEEINYAVGGHHVNPKGRIQYSTEIVLNLHQKFVFGYEYLLQRANQSASRMSEENRRKNLGSQYWNPNHALSVQNQWQSAMQHLKRVIP